MTRSGIGVKAIRLGVNDEVIGLELEEEGTELLCMTEKGFGKLTPFAKYRKTKRGARGVKAMRIDANSGNIAACRTLLPGMKLIITTSLGKVIQIDTNEIPKRLSRISRGVKLIRVDENDKVMAVARDILEEDEILEIKEKKVLKQNQFIMMRERKRIKDHKIKEDLELKKEADLNNEVSENEQKNNKEGEEEA